MMGRIKEELGDLTGSVSAPVRALVISLVSVWLATRWLKGDHTSPFVIAGVIIFVAYVLDLLGRFCLPDSPRVGLAFIELWIFAPLMLAAVASGIAVVIAVKLSVADNAPVERKQTIGAITTAITTFLASGFISWMGDKDDSRIAKRIQRIFFSKYKRAISGSTPAQGVKYFRAGSRGERLVYSNEFAGAEGWGRDARLLRARELAKEIASGASNP